MREIKFKGKRADNGDWVIGSLVMVCDGESLRRYPCIVISFNHDTFDWHEVLPEAVGQFTGLTDKNGKEIFEGDIIMTKSPYRYFIAYKNGAFYAYHCEIKDIEKSPYRWGLLSRSDELDMEAEVIGNIHDNPELIK